MRVGVTLIFSGLMESLVSILRFVRFASTGPMENMTMVRARDQLDLQLSIRIVQVHPQKLLSGPELWRQKSESPQPAGTARTNDAVTICHSIDCTSAEEEVL